MATTAERIPVHALPETPSDLFEGVAPPDQAAPPPQASTLVSRVIYLSLVLLPGLLVLVVLLARAGIISTRPHQGKTPWDLAIMVASALVVLTVAVLVARRAPKLLERSRSVSAIDAKAAGWELRALVATLVPAALLVTTAFLAWSGVLRLGIVSTSPMGPPMLGAIAVFLTCAAVGYFSYTRERNVRQLEERFPDFLRDLNESYGAGLTMAQAIRVAARGDYGRLTPEIRQMANQVSWGTPFTDALKMFAERVGTPIITRSVALIIKATRAGGNTKDVLHAASRDAREIKGLQQERRLSMTLYVIVIYVAFAVFLGVVAALQGLLVPALLKGTQGTGGGIAGLSANFNISFNDFRLIYFGVGLVQAVGSGIVAGTMAEGSYAAGLKHTTILVLASVVVLGILL